MCSVAYGNVGVIWYVQAPICLRVTIHVGSERLQRMKALKKIYREIAAWQQDSECVPRICSAVNPFADLVVVGEAIGPDTVRCSGVNYFRLDGHLGDSGQNLEEILSRVGLTLYPGSDLRLPTGRVLEASLGGGRQTVYSTDLCPEYPGHIGSKGQRAFRAPIKRARPSKRRIRDAIRHGFLDRELKIVLPKAILLLGREAYSAFYTYLLGATTITNLKIVIDNLSSSLSSYRGAVVIPFWHPSPASLVFQKWFKEFRSSPANNHVIECIRTALVRNECASSKS